MNRITVLSLLLFLAAAATFAQISGTVDTRMYLLDTYFEEDAEMMTWGKIHSTSLTLTGSGQDRTFGAFGGQLRVLVEWDDREDKLIGNPWNKAFVWWRPHQQFEIFLGQNPDGQFESAVLAGYNFHQGNEEFLGVMVWDFWRAVFPGNWDTFGLALTYRPIRSVQLNLVIPTGGPELYQWPRHRTHHVQRKVRIEDMYPWGLRLNGTVDISDIGSTVYFSYIGPEHQRHDARNKSEYELPSTNYPDGQIIDRFEDRLYENYGDIGLSFLMRNLVPGLQFQIGGSTRIPVYNDTSYPIFVGAAAHYQTNTAGLDWGVKFRFGTAFNMSDVLGGDQRGYEYPDPFLQYGEAIYMHGNIMPWIDLSGWRICFDVGMTALSFKDEFLLGWWISPYVKFGPFEAGIHLMTVGRPGVENAGWRARIVEKDSPVKLTIPIRMVFHF